MFIIDTSPHRISRMSNGIVPWQKLRRSVKKNVTRNSNSLNGAASKGYKLIVLQISDSFLYIVCLSMDLGYLRFSR
jgi:hypothetical protein